ncbi:MAG: aldehyde dehydrogenase family protein, partial [Deinococcales bacterium]
MPEQLLNYIGGSWQTSSSSQFGPVHNPATAGLIAEVPLSAGEEVAKAVQIAQEAFKDWRETPVGERIQPL